MCDSCYDPTGGGCGCDPCLVLQGSNWCTVCAHHGNQGVPAVTEETAYSAEGDTGAWGAESDGYEESPS